MPRNLEPTLIALDYALARGALVALPDPNADAGSPGASVRILRFQYNPESLSRTRNAQWDFRYTERGVPSEEAMNSEAEGGALFVEAESITLTLIFDATELVLRGEPESEFGILPELALLETVSRGRQPPSSALEDLSARPLTSIWPWELLLVLGPRRFPVVITSLGIDEQRFDNNLVPVRAKVDLGLQVLEPQQVQSTQSAFATAFEQLEQDRRSHMARAVSLHSGDDVDDAIAAALTPRTASLL